MSSKGTLDHFFYESAQNLSRQNESDNIDESWSSAENSSESIHESERTHESDSTHESESLPLQQKKKKQRLLTEKDIPAELMPTFLKVKKLIKHQENLPINSYNMHCVG